MLDEWPMSGAETAAPPQSEAEALCAELSARDDLRRAPDVIDAALELLQKWLQRRRAGAAAIGFVTRADAGADGQRELTLRVAGAGFAEPLPAGDEVPATLSLLRSGRKSLLIEDGGFIASHFGRAAKRRLGTDCRGVTCALVALGDDEASRCGVIEVLSARPLGRALENLLVEFATGCSRELIEAAGRYAAARLDVIVAGAQGIIEREQARLAARNVAAAAKPADGDGDGDGDAPGDGDGDRAPVDAPKAAAAAAAAALSDKLVVQERRNLVLRQLGAESARWAALPSDAGALRERWTALPAAAATRMGKALDFRLRHGAAFEATLRRKRGADVESAWNGEYSFVCGGEHSELYHAILRGGAELWTAVRAAEADEGEEAAAAADDAGGGTGETGGEAAADGDAEAGGEEAEGAGEAGAGGDIDEFGRTVGEAESEKLAASIEAALDAALEEAQEEDRAAADDESVPTDGWEFVADGEYYWHPATGAVRWEPPPAADGSGGWQQLRDEQGNVYFWNRESGETSWTAPDGAAAAAGEEPSDAAAPAAAAPAAAAEDAAAVTAPTSAEQRQLIERTAAFIAQNGDGVAASLLAREGAALAFLSAEHPLHAYYLQRRDESIEERRRQEVKL